MNKDNLWNIVQIILARGNDVEIKKKPDGTVVVLEVKKHIVTK